MVNSQHAPAFTACNVGEWQGGERSGAPERSPDASALPPLPQASEPSEHEQSGAPLVDPPWTEGTPPEVVERGRVVDIRSRLVKNHKEVSLKVP